MSEWGPFQDEAEFLAAYDGDLGDEWEAEADAMVASGDVEIELPEESEEFDEGEVPPEEEDQVGDYIVAEIERLENQEGREFSAEEHQAIAALAFANWTADGPNVEGAYQHLLSESDYGYDEGWKAALDAEVTAVERDQGRRLTSAEIGRIVDKLPQGEIPNLVEQHGDELRSRRKVENKQEREEFLMEVADDARAENPPADDLDAPQDERQARLMEVAENARAEVEAAETVA